MAQADKEMRLHGQDTGEWDSDLDERNRLRLKEIISQIGWPTISQYGREVSSAAWLIAQHSDPEPVFQAECLDLIHQLADDEIDPTNLAYFEDRVRVNQGKPQIYGTQFHMNVKKGILRPRPIEDEANLEERRKAVGLNSMAEYTAEMRAIYQRHKAGIKNNHKPQE